MNYNISSKETDLTLLYSQGNSTNLGNVYSTLVDISSVLKVFTSIMKVDIVCYDYSGYGESEGTTSEQEICNDIEEVAEFMKDSLLIIFEKVILYIEI